MACHWVQDEQSHKCPIMDLVTFQLINVVCFECFIDLNSVVCFIRSQVINSAIMFFTILMDVL
jgi:hypothetical protein